MGYGVEFDWYDADEPQVSKGYDGVLYREDGTQLIFWVKSYLESGKNFSEDEKKQLFVRVNTKAFSGMEVVNLSLDALQNPTTPKRSHFSSMHELAHYQMHQIDKLFEHWILYGHREQVKQAAKVTGWIAGILPCEWRSDLEELRYELLTQRCSRLLVSLATLKSLLEMVWAGIWIRWLDAVNQFNQKIL